MRKRCHIFGRVLNLKMKLQIKNNFFNRFVKVNRHFELYSNFVVFLEDSKRYINHINPIKPNLILIALIGFFKSDLEFHCISNNYNEGVVP